MTVVATLILLLPFLIRPYIVTGISMQPTFQEGDYLLVEKISPRLIGLFRGSPVVFRDPRNPQHPIILKRVIGLPNETIRIANGSVTAERGKGGKWEEGGAEEKGANIEKWEEGEKAGNGPDFEMKLGPEDYFLMGDNRAQSEDSRVWGTIQPSEMIGTVLFKF